MTVQLSMLGGAAAQFLDNSGSILSGGKLYTYAAGTTTPLATFTNNTGVTNHTNPIILDSTGRIPGGEIWLTDGVKYKFIAKTSADVTIATYDNIEGNGSGIYTLVLARLAENDGASLIGYQPLDISAVATNVQAKLREIISVNDFGAVGDGVTDDTLALANAFDYAAANSIPLYFVSGLTYLCDLNAVNVTLAEGKVLTIYGNNALLKQRTANTDVGGNPALITIQAETTLSTTTEVNIYGLNFDGSVQPIEWLSYVGTGSNAIKILDVYAVQIDGCKAQNFWFSSVFQFLRVFYANVTNCYMEKVGGHTILDDSASSNGEPIIFFDIPNSAAYHVSNCTFIGYPTTPYQNGYPHNLSRAGIVFEQGNGVNPAFKGTINNCYFDGFSNVIHVEGTFFADISVSNITAINGWSLIFGAGQFFKIRVDNCSWSPNVTGTYNGINGFAMCDIAATDYTIDVHNSYYSPVSANRMDGTYYGCTFDNFTKDNFQCGGTTEAFYNCTFNGIVGGPGSDYLFFGDTFQIFEGCTFNGSLPGSSFDFKLSFESRLTSPLRIMNCTFNDCGLWVNGDTGSNYILDGSQFKYTAAIPSLIIVNNGSAVTGKIKNSCFIADSTSINAQLNSSVNGTLTEFVNSYVRNATLYTLYGEPFTMLGSTIEFDATATPTSEGFFGRFSDYVIVSACTFVSPTSTPITLAIPDLRNSSVHKISGVVSALANI